MGDEKRVRKQKEIEAKDMGPFDMHRIRNTQKEQLKKLIGIKGDEDYGTELSSGAEYARTQEANRAFKEDTPAPTVREVIFEKYPSVMKAGREAAAEERREARGKKKGGAVKSASKRADGCAQRGKTRGRIV